MRLNQFWDIVRHLSFYSRRKEIYIGNQTRYREKRFELLSAPEEIYDMPTLGLERINGIQEHKAKVINQDPVKIRKIANLLVYLQKLINNLQMNDNGIHEER